MWGAGEVGGRHVQVGEAGLEAVLDVSLLLSFRGWEVRGQIEIGERRSKALRPLLSITLPPTSSTL